MSEPTVEHYRAAIEDIRDHATPLGEDADGFVTGGYLITVGSLHRALGLLAGSVPLSDRDDGPSDLTWR